MAEPVLVLTGQMEGDLGKDPILRSSIPPPAKEAPIQLCHSGILDKDCSHKDSGQDGSQLKP